MDLVLDVERYPEFIPAMTALRKTRDLPTGFEADAMINYKGIVETFASRVTIDRDARAITAIKTKRGGPVKSLDNRWRFYELSDGSTLVDFFVDVRLVFPLEALLKQKFSEAKTVISEVFLEEAETHCDKIGNPASLDLLAETARLGLSHRLS